VVGLDFGECHFGVRGGAGALLPLYNGLPILGLFFIELVFPSLFWFFTVTTEMPAFVASSAVAALDVVVQLALGLGGDFVPVDDGFKVRSFQTSRELRRLFVVRSTGQVSFVRVGFVAGLGRVSCLGIFVGLRLGLVPFFFYQFDLRLVEQVCDRRLDATKMRWVRTIINRTLDSF
jgi:hypothetical protein